MQFTDVHIASIIKTFFLENFSKGSSVIEVNKCLKSASGINDFFSRQEDFDAFLLQLNEISQTFEDASRTEYGDFQTNKTLASAICQLLVEKNVRPEIIMEPTFGKGSFMLAALKQFPNIKKIYGVEIHEPYVWQTKFAILQFALSNTAFKKPEIIILHQDVFEVDFSKLVNDSKKEMLVLGNPPWVTNSTLTTLNSTNLPKKSNFKKHRGLDALTGKGNFDIGEYITLMLLRSFSPGKGHLAFLIKNAVIKNLVFDQRQNQFPISNLEQYTIDAQREFGASVSASLFYCQFGPPASQHITTYDFYAREKLTTYGWKKEKFVSNINDYERYTHFDGLCPFEWRQGMKHDCSKIMELERVNGQYINKLDESVKLESDLVYGILKSSDLKGGIVQEARKFTIVTQQQIGQDTKYIAQQYPEIYKYLTAHKAAFDSRKSSIYKGKPAFSIFGIGDYSFKPYKVAISGLYKDVKFTFVSSKDQKPFMLDDTCYFLGFEKYEDAIITHYLLNKKGTLEFLEALIFADAKRVVTKELLMRIDLSAIAKSIDFEEIKNKVSLEAWDKYLEKTNFQLSKKQISLFD